MQYKILYHESLDKLSKKINKKAKKGWRVNGGLMIDDDDDYMILIERPKQAKKVQI